MVHTKCIVLNLKTISTIIIGVRFDDGYPGIDGFKNKNK